MHRRTNPKTLLYARELRHNLTEPEIRLWQAIRLCQLNNTHFRRQHALGTYVVDFCSTEQKLIIEVDGNQHLDQKEYDDARTAFLVSKGYRVLRFWNSDVMNNLDAVLHAIRDAIETQSSE